MCKFEIKWKSHMFEISEGFLNFNFAFLKKDRDAPH